MFKSPPTRFARFVVAAITFLAPNKHVAPLYTLGGSHTARYVLNENSVVFVFMPAQLKPMSTPTYLDFALLSLWQRACEHAMREAV